MQKLAREYLDELNKRHKKNRRALVAWILMAVLVVGGVMGTLAQYGVAFEGSPECGKEAHTHDDGCYTETQELICDLAEGEEHTHDDACYTVSKELTCELEEHTHGDECVREPEGTEAPRPEETTTAPADDNTEPEGTEGTAAETETQPATEDESTDFEEITESETETETETETEIETETEPESEETLPAEFEATEKIDGGKVEIHVTAGEGVLPEDAQLKAVPVVKQDIEKLKKKDGVTSEEIEAAKEINEKYDAVSPALEKTIPEDEIKKIAGFTAYDISFLAPDEDGEMTEFEPQGEVGVEIKFTQAFLPESVADHEGIEITDVNLVHMRESGKELIAETMEDAEFVLTEDSEVKNVSFTSEDFSIYAVAWTRGPQKLEYEDDDVIISVEEAEIGNIPEGAALNVVPVVEENEETEEQYRTIEEKLKESAAEENDIIAGFMAYDLSLADQDGTVIEPEGDVKVAIEYKEAAAPETIVPEITDVSMVMLNLDGEENTEEAENAEKPQMFKARRTVSAAQPAVIDLAENGSETTMEVTENKELWRTETVTSNVGPMAAVWRSNFTIQKVTIVDEIDKDGCLKVELNETAQRMIDTEIETARKEAEKKGEEFKSEGIIRFEWKKNINNDGYKPVKKEKVGDEYNVADDGAWLNVVLDKGSLNHDENRTSVDYMVDVYYHDELIHPQEYAVKYSKCYPDLSRFWPAGSYMGSQNYYSVLYWNELQNGSFEKPEINRYDEHKLYDQLDMNDQTLGLVWRTTDKEEQIEIGRVGVTDYGEHFVWTQYNWYEKNWFANNIVPDGVQFAEINARGEGALYQDVLTVPGQNLNYWLSHRARGCQKSSSPEYDTMYVVIVPVDIAMYGGNDNGPIDTQEEVITLMKDKDQYKGVYVQPYTSDDQSWHNYEGEYTPTSYLTRFFFVSGDKDNTASGQPAEGNFLDRVGFSQKLPPAEDGTFDLKITKKVEGFTFNDLILTDTLSEEEISNNIKEKIAASLSGLKFEIKATDKDGNDVANAPCVNKISEDGSGGLSITEPGWKWSIDGDGNYIGVYEYKNNSIAAGTSYTYTVTERGENITSYTCQQELKIIGGEVRKDNDGKFVSTTLEERDSVRFEFTNTYTSSIPDTIDLQIRKIWNDSDNMYKIRPESIKVLLENLTEGSSEWTPYITAEHPDGVYIFTQADLLESENQNQWDIRISDVTQGAQYRITEIEVDSNYVASDPVVLSGDDTTATITNTLKWSMIKRSSSDHTKLLRGAKFKLEQDGEIRATLTSGENGIIQIDDSNISLDGTYTMSETEAPKDYMLSGTEWTVTFKDGALVEISGDNIQKGTATENGKEIPTVYIENSLIYELPSTGGSGIYRYMISGVLLMLAGVLILYNNKRARRCAGV